MPQLAEHLNWTYEDFLLFPDDGKRHELIDGEHIMSDTDVVKPDLFFIASEHASIITEKHIMGVPDLVGEII
jgi:hypothetical protein